MKQCSHFVYQYTPISELALYLFFVSVVVVFFWLILFFINSSQFDVFFSVFVLLFAINMKKIYLSPEFLFHLCLQNALIILRG